MRKFTSEVDVFRREQRVYRRAAAGDGLTFSTPALANPNGAGIDLSRHSPTVAPAGKSVRHDNSHIL